jgi:hypothetical protein
MKKSNLVEFSILHALAPWKYVKCCIKDHENIEHHVYFFQLRNILLISRKITIYLNTTYPKTLPKLKPPKTTATALDRSCKGMDLHVSANESLKFQTTLAKCQNVCHMKRCEL